MRHARVTNGTSRISVAVNLANEGATASMVGALKAAQVRAIVLKGPPLRRWLYGNSPDRVSMDIDLLVPWPDLAAIERALSQIGWRYLGIDALGRDRPHCRIWERPDNGLILELHQNIAGVGLSGGEAWEVFSSRTEEVMIGGVSAEVLDLPARAMHVALHAAQHGVGFQRTMRDLELALEKPVAVWQQAAALAVQLDAVPAFTAGLALLPKGQSLLEQLRLASRLPIDIALRASSPPPTAEGLEWGMRLPGLRAKARFALEHLVPPPEYMRVWLPLARRGKLGLAAGYVWRPAWLLVRIGPAVRAWRRARRDSGPAA
jgi:hypothetical protein